MELSHDTELSPVHTASAQGAGVRISLEWVVYLALILFALALRLPELGTAALDDRQAHEALAAFRAVTPALEPRPENTAWLAHSPLMFAANTLLMTLAGPNNATVLFPTALIGVLIVALPLLFRRWLKMVHTLMLVILLTISPVLLISSRTMGASVWTLALVLGMFYGAASYLESGRNRFAVAAAVCGILALLAAEGPGVIMVICAVGGMIYAAYNDETPDTKQILLQAVRHWPYLRSLVAAAIGLALVGTVFLLYPRGLNGIGDVVQQAVMGLLVRPADNMFAFPLVTSIFYEPLLWIFGLVGAYQVLNGDERGLLTFVGRTMVGWLLIAFLAALAYQGAQPEHALWFTLPLSVLSALSLEKLLYPVEDPHWEVPTWGPYLHGLAVFAMLAICGIHLVSVGHSILLVPPDSKPDNQALLRAAFIVAPMMLLIITFFLVGSLWGAKASWVGMGIGFAMFLAIYGLGVGWRAAVQYVDDPREIWRVKPAASNLFLLEKTLMMASQRATSAPYDMPLVVVKGPNGPTEDDALAWALRRFRRLQFVNQLVPNTNVPAVIMLKPASREQIPADLSAAYVGQDFPVYFTWSRSTLSWDGLAWFYERLTRVPPQGSGHIIVWIRSDIYGVPAEGDVVGG